MSRTNIAIACQGGGGEAAFGADAIMDGLIAQGETAARQFLVARASLVASSSMPHAIEPTR